MTIWMIVGVALAVLGVLLFIVLQMPETVQKKRKKKHEPLPEPPKDWKAIAERLEKRVVNTEQTLQGTLDELKGRDKKIEEFKKAAAELQRHLDQEKVWREKEEALVAKEKKQERVLREELEKTRADLNTESTQRIKQEYELKELRQIREELSGQVRKLSSQGMQLERSLAEALRENKGLKDENRELSRKKEGEEWVLKADYKRLEGFLKRARWEVEQFKKKIPVADWPRPLQPKPAASAVPSGAGVPPVASDPVGGAAAGHTHQEKASPQGVDHAV